MKRTPGKKYPANGKKLSMKQWAAEVGCTPRQFYNRFIEIRPWVMNDNEAVAAVVKRGNANWHYVPPLCDDNLGKFQP